MSTRAVKALKAAARRAERGQYPLLQGYTLTAAEKQALMDGKSPHYEVVGGQGTRALRYRNEY